MSHRDDHGRHHAAASTRGGGTGGPWLGANPPAGPLHEVFHKEPPLAAPEERALRDIVLPNGNHLQMIEPLRRYRARRSEPGFEADLSFEGLRPPHSHPVGVPPFWRGRHFDQAMHATGQIVVHGEIIDIDSYSIRDRSWGPRPGPHVPGTSKPRGPRPDAPVPAATSGAALDLSAAMTSMMIAQRAFSAQLRVLKTADQMLQAPSAMFR